LLGRYEKYLARRSFPDDARRGSARTTRAEESQADAARRLLHEARADGDVTAL